MLQEEGIGCGGLGCLSKQAATTLASLVNISSVSREHVMPYMQLHYDLRKMCANCFASLVQMDSLRDKLERTANEITRTVNKYLSSLDECTAQRQLVQDASQSLRILQQQEWADKMSDNLSAISETIATERQKSMTAVKQVESLRDELLSLQETTKIAMEAMLNSHRKIEAALSNGKACSQQDRKPFTFKPRASMIQEVPAADRQPGKGFETSMQDSLEGILPSMSACQFSPVVSTQESPLEDSTRIENLVDGVNSACHHEVPSHDLRWDKTSKT